jgi:hypothetical protein
MLKPDSNNYSIPKELEMHSFIYSFILSMFRETVSVERMNGKSDGRGSILLKYIINIMQLE